MPATPRPHSTRGWLLTVASTALLAPSCASQHDDGDDEPAQSSDRTPVYDAGVIVDGGYPPGVIAVTDAGVVVAPDGGPWSDDPDGSSEPVYDAGTVVDAGSELEPDAAADAATPPCVNPAGFVVQLPDGGCWPEAVGLVAR
jgi:hypothetical protein